MSTEAQIAANRANAQHSTGPQSAAGKAASSQNRRLLGLALSGLRVTRPKRGLKLPRTGLTDNLIWLRAVLDRERARRSVIQNVILVCF